MSRFSSRLVEAEMGGPQIEIKPTFSPKVCPWLMRAPIGLVAKSAACQLVAPLRYGTTSSGVTQRCSSEALRPLRSRTQTDLACAH
jgi:hypothetical protein